MPLVDKPNINIDLRYSDNNISDRCVKYDTVNQDEKTYLSYSLWLSK